MNFSVHQNRVVEGLLQKRNRETAGKFQQPPAWLAGEMTLALKIKLRQSSSAAHHLRSRHWRCAR
jgi:hypothetical protein